MSKFLSGLDKTVTNALYEIDIDHATGLPSRIRVTLLTGRKGETEVEMDRIVGGRHVAFHFEYRISDFGEKDVPDVPKEALKLLAGR